jgi:hypothetical protein
MEEGTKMKLPSTVKFKILFATAGELITVYGANSLTGRNGFEAAK